MRKHALLSASGSAMWIACPPSARLNDAVPEQTSEYAEEGTLGHDMVENELLYLLGTRDHNEFERLRNAHHLHPRFSQELDEAVTACVRYGWNEIEVARMLNKNVLVQIEQTLDYSRWAPEGFGTGDLVIITTDYIHVIDWKFGRGEWVDAQGNSQLRLYAAGALDLYGPIFGPFKEVRATVVQPRVGNIDTETLTPEGLLQWCEAVVAPAAQLAWAGEGEFNPGHKQCRWCKVRGECRARAEYALAIAHEEFRQPVLMSDAEIAALYPQLDEIILWAQDVQEHAHKRVLQGAPITGLKAVEGRSNRVISDPVEAMRRLTQQGGYDFDEIAQPEAKERMLLPIPQLQKLLGPNDFKLFLGDLITKPPGKVVVVPATDKRVALDLAPTTPEEDFA